MSQSSEGAAGLAVVGLGDQKLTTPSETGANPPVEAGVKGLYRRRFVKRDVPPAVRVMQALDLVLVLAFANPVMAFVIDVGAFILATIFVTSAARDGVDSGWFSVGVIVLVVLLWLGLVWQSSKTIQFLARLQNGPPAFGDLGGLPKRLLRTTIRASKGLKFELTQEDAALMEEYASVLRAGDEVLLREKFLEVEDGEDDGWADVWERELLAYPAGDLTLRDAYKAHTVGIIPLRLVQVGQLVGPMFLAFQFLLSFLAYRALTGAGSWVTVFQVGLVVTFVLTMIIYLNHVKSLQTIQLLETPQELLEKLPDDLQERVTALVGAQIVPIRVAVTPSYFSAIRDYFAGAIAVVSSFNALVQLVAVGVAFLASIPFADSRGDVASDYGKLALTLAVIPFGILAAFYLASLLIQHVRHFAAIALGGLVTALAPLALTYLAKGEVPDDTRSIVTAAAAGLVGTLTAALGTFLTERIGASSRPQPA